MMRLTSKEMYKTSMGTAFIIDKSYKLKVGDEVVINGVQYKIKNVINNSRPSNLNSVAILV